MTISLHHDKARQAQIQNCKLKPAELRDEI